MKLKHTHLIGQQDVAVVDKNMTCGRIKVGITDAWTVDAREEIFNQAQEQWHILEHELGEVHVAQHSHEYHRLGQIL